MELALLVYGISVLSGVGVLLTIACILSAIGVFILLTFANIEPDSAKEYSRPDSSKYQEAVATIKRNIRIAKRLAIVAVVCSVLLVLIPKEKTAWLMVGAYAVQQVASNPATRETSDKVVKLINKKLDEYIK